MFIELEEKNGERIFRTQEVPRVPGVYVYRNRAGEVIYVGKARNLRARMSQYFRKSSPMREDPRRRALLHSIVSYEIFPVETENEALLLESRFIKQYNPRYNVLLRDDKRFYHICVDMSEDFPRLQLSRIRREDRKIYIGPFPQSQALKETVEFLNLRYHLRCCDALSPNEEDYRHCLDHITRGCMAPCLGKISREEYHKLIEEILALFRGEGAPALLHELDTQMRQAAAEKNFEEAAHWRDILANLKAVLEPARRFRNQTMLTRKMESDPVGMLALKEVLGMNTLPMTMECFDMSNIAGTLAVGSMVCFKEGRPDTSLYRRYKIRSPEAKDDTAFMAEVLERRYGRLLRENLPLPDLIVLDGGAGQVHAAGEVFQKIGLHVPYIGLAKKFETIVRPDGPPILLPREHAGLRMLQAIRDEAHRWANGFNRELRAKRISDSLLDEVPGIGEKRRVELLKKFGSVRTLAKCTPGQISSRMPGIGPILARQITKFLSDHIDLPVENEVADDPVEYQIPGTPARKEEK